MGYLTYTAKRKLETTGYAKSGVDLSVAIADDSINAAGPTVLTGLLQDQWVLASGFTSNSGWFQAKADATSGKLLLSTPPPSHVRLPGVSGNYANTPDSGANSITVGDLTIVVRALLNDWTPAAVQTLLAKWNTSGNQRSYALSVNTDGTLNYSWSADGTAVISKNSTVATGIADLSKKFIKVTHKFNNGAAGNDVKFWLSDDGVVYTQLGTTVTTAGTTSIFNSTALLEVGSINSGTAQLAVGRVFYATLKLGIDGATVAEFDPSTATRGATSFVAPTTGETWTISSSGTPPAMLQGPVMVTEAAGFTVSLVGYKRGLGQSYSLEFNADQADRSVEFSKTENQPIGGGAPEVIFDRGDELLSLSIFGSLTGAIDDAAMKQWREAIWSMAGGEAATVDRYGTLAAPVEPLAVVLKSNSYREERIASARYFKFSLDFLLT